MLEFHTSDSQRCCHGNSQVADRVEVDLIPELRFFGDLVPGAAHLSAAAQALQSHIPEDLYLYIARQERYRVFSLGPVPPLLTVFIIPRSLCLAPVTRFPRLLEVLQPGVEEQLQHGGIRHGS